MGFWFYIIIFTYLFLCFLKISSTFLYGIRNCNCVSFADEELCTCEYHVTHVYFFTEYWRTRSMRPCNSYLLSRWLYKLCQEKEVHSSIFYCNVAVMVDVLLYLCLKPQKGVLEYC